MARERRDEKADVGKVEETVPQVPVTPAAEVPAGKGNGVAGPEVKLNPPNPVTYRFICGVCHTTHAGQGEELANRTGSIKVLDRKVTAAGLPLVEILCLRCGMATWKVAPEYKGPVQGLFANMLLKRG